MQPAIVMAACAIRCSSFIVLTLKKSHPERNARRSGLVYWLSEAEILQIVFGPDLEVAAKITGKRSDWTATKITNR